MHTPINNQSSVNDIFTISINGDRYKKVGTKFRQKYIQCYDKYIKPPIGSVPVGRLTPSLLCTLFNSISLRTDFEYARSIMIDIIKYSLDCKLISGNPMDPLYFEGKKTGFKCLRTLSEEELPIFIFLIENDPMRNVFYLSLFTGLRLGECLGLKWHDVDFDNHVITVRHQVRPSDNTDSCEYQVVDHTKTKNDRCIVMIPLLEDIFKNERLRQQRKANGSLGQYSNMQDLIFTDNLGNPYHTVRVQNSIKQIGLRMDIPDLSFHSLRRTFATQAILIGTDLSTVQQMLDHYEAALTLQHYIACTDGMLQNTADKINTVMSRFNFCR